MENRFEEKIRNLEFAKKYYLNEILTLVKHKDKKVLENNKKGVLMDIEAMIKSLEELRETIK